MPRQNEKLAQRARLACEKWHGYFKYNIDQYHLMNMFVMGQQWTDEEQDDMIKTFRKVPLTSNKLATMANTLLGEQQQNTPQIQVVPMTNCDEEVAHIRELITKDIMFSAEATIAIQMAASQAAVCGYGAFGIKTEYSSAKSFDLDIKYFWFKDATRTYFDLGAEEVNKTDGSYCGYLTRVSREKFRAVWGKELEERIAKINALTESEGEIALAVQPNFATDPFNWSDGEGITIMNHFERKYVKDTLYKLSNGKVYNQEEMDEMIEYSRDMNQKNRMMELQQELMGQQQGIPGQEQMPMQGQMPEGQEGMQENPPPDNMGFGMVGDEEILPNENGLEIKGKEKPVVAEIDLEETNPEFMTLWDEGEMVRIEEKRPSKRAKIMHYQIAGDYELDKTEFPSEQLPIVFMDNSSYFDKAGKQVCRSFFGDAKDTQRYINYLRTQSAYILKVSRYDQWVGSKKNAASLDTQRNWRDPNAVQGMLTYDESPNGDKPWQIKPPELSQSLFTQYQLAVEDLYTSTGLYPARMGNNGDEASGKAINARTRQGSYATYTFFNSINRAQKTGGAIVNEMIPRVYDTERVIALMTPDEGMKNITINQQIDEYGEKIKNDIRKGTYEVRLLPGPSYEGQKQEALDSLQQILQADPTSFSLIADLYAENLPLMNNIEIKNRLKTKVDPNIIEAGKTGKMPQQGMPNPEQQAMQMQQQQMQQQTQFKQQELQLKAKELELKQQEIAMEAQFKIQELETERLQTAGQLEEQKLRYEAETMRTAQDGEIAHANNLVRILTHKI